MSSETGRTRRLRTTAFVLLVIAAVDGVITLVEHLTHAELWMVLLATGLVLLVVDVATDQQTILGRKCSQWLDWLSAKLAACMAWFGRKMTSTVPSEQASSSQSAANPEPNSGPSGEGDKYNPSP